MLNALRLSDRGRRLFLLEGILGSIEHFDRHIYVGLRSIGVIVDHLGVRESGGENGPGIRGVVRLLKRFSSLDGCDKSVLIDGDGGRATRQNRQAAVGRPTKASRWRIGIEHGERISRREVGRLGRIALVKGAIVHLSGRKTYGI